MSNLKIDDIKKGSVVIVRPAFGIDPPIEVTVIKGLEPHKYARAFGYRAFGRDSWAYDHQIESVVSL